MSDTCQNVSPQKCSICRSYDLALRKAYSNKVIVDTNVLQFAVLGRCNLARTHGARHSQPPAKGSSQPLLCLT